MNLVATMFATQPVCNAARAAHALRSDQYIEIIVKNKPSHICHVLFRNTISIKYPLLPIVCIL